MYGLPTNIVSDCDHTFNSHFWREVFKKLDSRLLHLSTINNLEVISINFLKICYKHMLGKVQSNWEDYLPILEFAYNTAKHVTTRFSPFILMYAIQPRSPIMVGLVNKKLCQVKDFLQDCIGMLQIACQKFSLAQDCYKKYADAHQRQR